MLLFHLTALLLIAAAAFAARWPHLDFPLDEDLATYTYIARFRHLGFRWKHDAMLFLSPVWRFQWIDRLYGRPEGGPRRVRLFLAAHNALSGMTIYGIIFSLTSDTAAALVGGIVFAVFLTAPSLESESFNTEQCYVPFLLAGFWASLLGPAWAVLAGLAFGLMTVTKISTGVYLPVFLGLMLWKYGPEPAWTCGLSAGLVIAFALAVDAARGFLDPESLSHIRTRMLATLRNARRDPVGPRVRGDLKRIVGETLPLWLIGLPTLIWYCFGSHGQEFLALTGVTLFILISQLAFSRYHYTPLVSILAMTTGLGLSLLVEIGGWGMLLGLGLFAAATAWTVRRQLPFYTRTMHPEVLARYGKFEQLLYLPYLGRLLARWLRRRGETGQRIYVWGNFIQLYHDTNCPAADTFIHSTMGPWMDPGFEPFFDSIIGGLIKHKPGVLVKTYPDLDLDLLRELTGLEYTLVKTILARYPVYRLQSFNAPAKNPLSLPWMEKSRWLEHLTRGRHTPGVCDADLQQGRSLTAFIECRKMLEINPRDRDGLVFFGELCEQFGLRSQAETVFTKVLASSPELPQVRLMLARQKLALFEHSETRRLIEEEIRLFGKTAESLQQLGRLDQSMGRHRPALELYQAAMELAPSRLDLKLAQAHCYESLGELSLARQLLVQVWEEAEGEGQEGQRTQAVAGLARVASILKPESETLAEYLKLDPENGPLAYALASAQEQEGLKETALPRFQKLASTLPTGLLQASAWFRVARLSEGEEQIRSLNECLKRNPYHHAAREMLANPEACHAEA